MKRKLSIVLAGTLLVALAAVAQNGQGQPGNGQGKAYGQGETIRGNQHSGTNGGNTVTGNGINYYGGQVMHNGVNIYYIWYGNWGQDPAANAILTDFANNIGGSSYFNINTLYGDSTANVPNTPTSIKYVTSTSDSGSLGTSLNDGSIWTLVNNALASGKLPVDPNGAYFVLTAPYVAETSGFLTQYCGWHTYNNYNGTTIKYAFVGNPAAGMSACAEQSSGPNGDAQADAMVSVIAHELEESATDPQLNAWMDSTGEENADKCAWTFGSEYAANGALANMKLGQRNFLIQQNWVNAGGGYCALSYGTGTPDYSLSVSPSSQSVSPGGTTGSYTVTLTPSGGYSGNVTYSVLSNTLPAGASAIVSSNTVKISTTTSIAAGTYNFTIQGTDGVLTHTVQATLSVTAPSFTISVGPSTVRVQRPGTGTFTVTVTPVGSFTGTINLTSSGATNGISLLFNSASLASGGGTSTLTATVTTAAKKGSHSITVTATSGSVSKSASATLQLQ